MDFKDILKFESNEKLWNFCFEYGNTMVWPYLRYKFFDSILYNSGESSGSSSDNNSSIISYIFNILKLNPYRIRNKDIIIFGTAVDNSFKINGKYFNRVHDYYNFCYPEDTAILESAVKRTCYFPRAFDNVYSDDYINIKISLHSRISGKNKKDIYMAREFVEFIKEEFPLKFNQNFYDSLYNNIIVFSDRLELYFRYYEKFFKKIKPAVIFLNCGYYGETNHITRSAKSLGIKVGEFQHGLVSESHPAYNFDEKFMTKSEEYYPEYYLTYGDYWNDKVKISGKTYTVGNPYFYAQIQRYKNTVPEKNTILVPSQWTITREMVKIADFLANEYKNYKIIFKLHPAEIKNYGEIEALEKYSNVYIEKSGDIFEYIAKSEIIVACYSTTIFEAFGMNKKIYILDNEFSRGNIPDGIGFWFKNEKELKKLIDNESEVFEKENDINYYFDKNWKENYKNFIENLIGVKIKNDKKINE